MILSENRNPHLTAASLFCLMSNGKLTLAGIILMVMLTGTLGGCGKENSAQPVDKETGLEAQLLEHLSQHTSDLQAQLALANLYYDTNRPHMAIPLYQEVLKHRPDDPAIRTDLGTCYKRLGALAQARAEYERVLKTHPEHTQTVYNLAVITYLEGDNPGAAELWERAAAQAPGTPLAQAALQHAAEAKQKPSQESDASASIPNLTKEKEVGSE